MSLEKAIEYRKEKRKAYRGSKAFDYSCRNHGSCNYCVDNRTIQQRRALKQARAQVDELYTTSYLDDLVSGLLTDNELVTVEEWNAEVDRRDEARMA